MLMFAFNLLERSIDFTSEASLTTLFLDVVLFQMAGTGFSPLRSLFDYLTLGIVA